MRRRVPFTAALWLGLAVLPHQFPILAWAETAPAEAKRLAVDVLWLKGGDELRGAVVDRESNGTLLMAVRRDWLRQARPKRFADEEAAESIRLRQADEQLLERIDAWLARRPEDSALRGVLTIERERCEARLAEEPVERAEFLLIRVPAEDLRRSLLQPPERRRVADIAWQLRLENVETTAPQRLEAALAERFKDWRSLEPDLSERIPPLLQDDDEWAARVAVWEYTHLQACDFQGTDRLVVRTDSAAARPDVMSVIGPALQDAVASQLADLLDPVGGQSPQDSWRTTATAAATKAQLPACRVTRANIDTAAMNGTVACDFLVRQPEGTWETLWRDRAATELESVTAGDLDRLRNDPQVQSVQKAFAGLGVEGDLDRALRFGAAVQVAQQTIDGRFLAFRDRFTRSLSGPPLRWQRARSTDQ
jgi:hypothetical protein